MTTPRPKPPVPPKPPTGWRRDTHTDQTDSLDGTDVTAVTDVTDDSSKFGNRGNGSNRDAEDGEREGARLLDKVEATLLRHVAFPSPHHAPVVAAWVAHTHLIEAFDSTPRLAVLSPEKGSGKTRVLEVIEPLLPSADLLLDPSPAVLFRSIDKAEGSYCVLLDECDATLGLGRLSETQQQVRAIVNAGYRRGAAVSRAELVGGKNWEPRKFQVFAPTALAGIGDLPDTIMDRSIIISMKRRRPQDRVQPWRVRMAQGLESLRDDLVSWAERNVDQAETLDADPHFLPDGVEDRVADVWGPVIISAALAGDAWHHRIVTAAQSLIGEHAEQAASLGVRLLIDIHTVFSERDVTQLSTGDLLKALHAMEGSPWGDLRGAPIDARFLARQLKKYDVTPRTLNLGGEDRAKGYALAADTDGEGGLADAFTRYLPESSVTSVTQTESNRSNGSNRDLSENSGQNNRRDPERVSLFDTEPPIGYEEEYA